MYRDVISNFVKKWRWLMLGICWMVVVGYWIISPSNFSFVVFMSVLCGLWLCYAIGSNGSMLNNRVTHYLSNISMEVYLCHMMAFRGVELLHLSHYIQQPDMLYWLTCLLTIGVAVVFSHIVKYKVLPIVEPYLFKQSK